MAAKQSELSYICIYYRYEYLFDRMSDEELGKVILALLDYVENGTIPDFKGGIRGAFASVMHQIKQDERSYQKCCDKKGGKRK